MAHGNGLVSSYSHMSEIAAEPGSIVRRGKSSAMLSERTVDRPHIISRSSATRAVNPLAVRFVGAPVVDVAQAKAVKARLKLLLSVGVKRA